MAEKKTNKKKEISIDLDNLTRNVYNKIALWTQEDGTDDQKSQGLLLVSREVIETIISEMFNNLDGVTTRVDTVAAKDFYNKKNKGFFNKMFK